MKKFIIGSDKSGFALKEAVKTYLEEQDYEVEDCGTRSVDQPMPYFKVAPILAKKIQRGEYEKGILICGTGAGMAVVANKFKGVYAVACESVYAAEKCRAINDANIMTMGGWIVAPELGITMAEKFLNTGFTDNLEEWRKDFLKNASKEVASMEDKIYD
ncbi:RpiB/LacA/LacB family sugar-phosphate isomerase [Caproiciproducens sp. NJN-50]|uniref:RpiB/LacA/LacB family sugar-phosphate isomerase n=1 Tax=Caproiciproducens sp. NJN-50 TaxID=2507162 RepID=UPI000FFE1567|nr:RpiB/LacA/LacB family sugar-phosphate isomerase [Caproiciproducens sp. NJN-50]QAT51205.1 RpiB/LacA/LacB family sugar-phosphate isomerase [Caproiciproducens sp. NJN-50]